VLSQPRTAVAQQAGLFDEDIVPLETRKLVMEKDGTSRHVTELLTQDEGNRP
jgi:acetyl-CoA C-acetyltransferase